MAKAYHVTARQRRFNALLVALLRRGLAPGPFYLLTVQGRMQRTFQLRELAPAESAPLLRDYLMRFAMVRPYFDVDPQASLEAFSAEATRHPVFQLIAL